MASLEIFHRKITRTEGARSDNEGSPRPRGAEGVVKTFGVEIRSRLVQFPCLRDGDRDLPFGMHLEGDRVVVELGAARFEDCRLATRLRGLAESFVAKPAASFPKALVGSAELEAAYRFSARRR